MSRPLLPLAAVAASPTTMSRPALLPLAAVAASPTTMSRPALLPLAAVAAGLTTVRRPALLPLATVAAGLTTVRRPALLPLAAVAAALAALLTAAPVASAPALDGELQNVADLEALAREVATREFPALTARQRFVIGPIDPNTQLERCRQPVKAALTSPHHMQDRATVELRCPDGKPWHLYVQVRVVGTSPAAVTAHAIVMGSVLKASDLRVEEHDISELPLGFLDDPAIAVGLTASRPIPGGTFITNQQLVAAKAVERGQSVTLVADADGIVVRMGGKALSDGLVNQRVRVQNLSSGKIVEGIARSAQVVEIVE
jgi:flagella basal body P-ring formation protein FlgA